MTTQQKASHTPGPWLAEESEIFAAAGDAVRIAETVPLADDPQDVPGFGRTELANARLIAAAPTLLEALKEAREMVLSWAAYAGDYFREKHSLADDVARLDAVIAKAEPQS